MGTVLNYWWLSCAVVVARGVVVCVRHNFNERVSNNVAVSLL